MRVKGTVLKLSHLVHKSSRYHVSLHCSNIFIMSTDQFYALWEKFALSDLVDNLPDDVEEFCKEHEITVDYFIQEFI